MSTVYTLFSYFHSLSSKSPIANMQLFVSSIILLYNDVLKGPEEPGSEESLTVKALKNHNLAF